QRVADADLVFVERLDHCWRKLRQLDALGLCVVHTYVTFGLATASSYGTTLPEDHISSGGL
ncbi:MAG: hypothetical protein ACYCSN_19980, partial [Acidobacteriaceae bacterium]